MIRVCDTETTGLTAQDRICELATVDLVPSNQAPGTAPAWVRGRMWSTLVNPERPIPPEASAIHHILDGDVADAPTLERVRASWLEGMDPAAPVFAAHNATFDRQFLSCPNERWICTYKVALLLWPDCPSHKNQVLRYWLGLKLADPALVSPHRALGDAYVTAAILARALRDFVITMDDMIEISSRPAILPRLTFGEHAMKPIAEVPTGYLEWMVKKPISDPDALYTAQRQLAERRTASRTRSPVHVDPKESP